MFLAPLWPKVSRAEVGLLGELWACQSVWRPSTFTSVVSSLPAKDWFWWNLVWIIRVPGDTKLQSDFWIFARVKLIMLIRSKGRPQKTALFQLRGSSWVKSKLWYIFTKAMSQSCEKNWRAICSITLVNMLKWRNMYTVFDCFVFERWHQWPLNSLITAVAVDPL